MNDENNIPKEHQIQCADCGEIFDARDLSQVFTHGTNYNPATNKCEPVDVNYGSSKKVGDSIEWTKDKKPINLN